MYFYTDWNCDKKELIRDLLYTKKNIPYWLFWEKYHLIKCSLSKIVFFFFSKLDNCIYICK